MWDQLPYRITASRRKRRQWLHSQLHRHRKRQRRQRPEPARRPEEESYQQPGREPRSCCRRHSTRTPRQKRLEQVWSSSIDTPEIIKNKILRPSLLLGVHPILRRDFRVFRRTFISLSPPG